MEKLNALTRTVYWCSKMANIVAGVALVAMMVLTFVNVLLRSIWEPILGTYEYTGFLAAVTISFSLAYCAVNKGHVAITLFTDKLPIKVQGGLEIITSMLGMALYLVLAWQCTKYANHIMKIGEVSATTEIPFYPFILLVALGFLLLAAVIFTDIFEAVKKVIK